ncbi:uncharacterized protein LOC144469708 [Augochlora pura]
MSSPVVLAEGSIKFGLESKIDVPPMPSLSAVRSIAASSLERVVEEYRTNEKTSAGQPASQPAQPQPPSDDSLSWLGVPCRCQGSYHFGIVPLDAWDDGSGLQPRRRQLRALFVSEFTIHLLFVPDPSAPVRPRNTFCGLTLGRRTPPRECYRSQPIVTKHGKMEIKKHGEFRCRITC